MILVGLMASLAVAMPVDSQPALGASLPVARAAWADSPCRDRETVTWVDGDYLDDEGYAVGLAWRDACHIQLARGLQRDTAALCTVLTHELGHLAGEEHRDDPDSVMNSRPTITAACQELR